MAARNRWHIRHRCGHRIEWDLSDKPPAKRAGFASWLAQRDCTRCWWAKRRRPDRHRLSPPASPSQPSARKQAVIEVWEQRNGMPVLDGSDPAVARARQIRCDLLATSLSTSADDRSRDALLSRAQAITAAGWWIDDRNIKAGLLFRRPNGPLAGQRTAGPL